MNQTCLIWWDHPFCFRQYSQLNLLLFCQRVHHLAKPPPTTSFWRTQTVWCHVWWPASQLWMFSGSETTRKSLLMVGPGPWTIAGSLVTTGSTECFGCIQTSMCCSRKSSAVCFVQLMNELSFRNITVSFSLSLPSPLSLQREAICVNCLITHSLLKMWRERMLGHTCAGPRSEEGPSFKISPSLLLSMVSISFTSRWNSGQGFDNIWKIMLWLKDPSWFL